MKEEEIIKENENHIPRIDWKKCKGELSYMNDIKNMLLELGFNVNSIGIIYWVEAINYVLRNPLWWDIMDIYDFIAQKYKISISQVERNLRTAIEPAKKHIQDKYKYYKPIKNCTFLNLIKLENMDNE